jgi:hypothetical protein
MALAQQEFRISLWRAEMGLAFALSGQTSARRPVVPVGTTVPTLVLSGQFDPVAGSALSRQVADEIGAHARGGAAVGVASGSIPHPSDHCVRFASAVADDCATLASRRCATALPGPVFHRQDRVSFA